MPRRIGDQGLVRLVRAGHDVGSVIQYTVLDRLIRQFLIFAAETCLRKKYYLLTNYVRAFAATDSRGPVLPLKGKSLALTAVGWALLELTYP